MYIDVLSIIGVFVSNIKTISYSKIFIVRNVEVMLDKDIANFYGVDVRTLNKAQSRHKERFQHDVFRLTKDEYSSILQSFDLPLPKGHLPLVYSKRAAFGVAYFLDVKNALEVAETILDGFIAFINIQRGLPNPENQLTLLNKKVLKLVDDLEKHKPSVNNHFLAPVTLIQGNQNQVQIGVQEEVVLNLFKLMSDSQVVNNQDLQKLLTIAIEKNSKKDKEGLLDTLKKIVETGSGLSSITTSIPAIIEVVKKII